MLTRVSVVSAVSVTAAVVLACLPSTPARSVGFDVRVQVPVERADGPTSLVEATWAELPLLADAVVPGADGGAVSVAPGTLPAADPGALRVQDAWLASGTVPGPSAYRALAEQALRDLDALMLPDGSVLAAASPGWDLVWPRDASFVAVALARTGHLDDARAVLGRLADLHASAADGIFEARYVPADGTVPDQRARQLDGCGWALWAVGEWWAAVGPDDAALDDLRDMITGCLGAIDREVDAGTGLPGAWADYWEVRESRPTLGTVAALAAGVRAIAAVADGLGPDVSVQVAGLAARLDRGVARFAPGFPRRLGGEARDTAVAFLMPPFAAGAQDGLVEPSSYPEVLAAWTAARTELRRPAGGFAPGGAWRQDGVSWTPTTAMFALTAAASGDRALALELVDWIAQHRTALGAIPEKVLADGSPAGPAPLAWTSALVLLTLDELDRSQAGGRDRSLPGTGLAAR